MKDLIVNIFKTLFFFDLSFVIMYYLPKLSLSDPALSRLVNEALILAVVVAFTLIFLIFVEKRKLKLENKKIKFKILLSGFATGAVFSLVTVAVLAAFKKFDFLGLEKVDKWYYWIAALLVNTIAVELYYRGYLFTLYKKYYGFITSTIITTLLYLVANTEIFSKGKIFVANVIVFNVLLCILLDYTKSLKFSIIVRFVYSFINVCLLGGISVAGEYPVLFKTIFNGKSLLTGGEKGIENSVIMLVLLSAVTVLLIIRKYSLIEKIKTLPLTIKKLLLKSKTRV